MPLSRTRASRSSSKRRTELRSGVAGLSRKATGLQPISGSPNNREDPLADGPAPMMSVGASRAPRRARDPLARAPRIEHDQDRQHRGPMADRFRGDVRLVADDDARVMTRIVARAVVLMTWRRTSASSGRIGERKSPRPAAIARTAPSTRATRREARPAPRRWARAWARSAPRFRSPTPSRASRPRGHGRGSYAG